MNVYLVYRENVQPDGGSNEDVIAVFAHQEDADNFVFAHQEDADNFVFAHQEDADNFVFAIEKRFPRHTLYVEERTLFYGQPSNPGYDK